MTDLRGNNAPDMGSNGSGVVASAIIVLLGLAALAAYTFATGMWH